MPGPANTVAGSSRKTSGRIQLKVQVIEAFEGTCGPTLQSMSDCYQDATLCGEATTAENLQLQTQIQEMFNPYIDAHAMSASDIPSLSNIAYEVQYE